VNQGRASGATTCSKLLVEADAASGRGTGVRHGNATIPVVPCDSAPTGLIRTLSCAPTPRAGGATARGDPADGPDGWLAGAEDGPGPGRAD
jgi:hypothetical protein